MVEQWEEWTPICNASGKYILDAITDIPENFSVTFSGVNREQKRIRVDFGRVQAYQFTDVNLQSNLIRGLDELLQERLRGSFIFYRVTNSRYLQWLTDQSYGFIPENFMHFSFVAENFILDVVDSDEPKIQILES